MEVLSLVLALAGLALGIVGYLGLVERLPRNNIAGVRTPSTMRSDAAFRVANKAGGVPTLIAGGLALAGGVATWLLPTPDGMLTAVLVTVAGMLAMVIVGGVLGVRAARTVTDQDPRWAW